MKNIFGIRSGIPANLKLKNGYTMHDWVMRQHGFPSFWGRDISGDDAITPEEIEFLRGRDCMILPVFSDLTEKAVSSANGRKDGERAATAAEALGIPQHGGIMLLAEIKQDWSINHNWMISFAQTLQNNGYVPGFIGNTDSSKNFNFDRQCSHYVQATQAVDQFGAVYGATEPKLAKAPTKWNPYCPSALNPEDMHLWSCGETTFDRYVVEDIYAKDDGVMKFMW